MLRGTFANYMNSKTVKRIRFKYIKAKGRNVRLGQFARSISCIMLLTGIKGRLYTLARLASACRMFLQVEKADGQCLGLLCCTWFRGSIGLSLLLGVAKPGEFQFDA